MDKLAQERVLPRCTRVLRCRVEHMTGSCLPQLQPRQPDSPAPRRVHARALRAAGPQPWAQARRETRARVFESSLVRRFRTHRRRPRRPSQMADGCRQAVARVAARGPEEGVQPGREAHPASTAPPRPLRGADVLIPPLNFSIVSKGVYRAGYPNEKNISFLRKLKLRTVLYVCPSSATLRPQRGALLSSAAYSAPLARACQVFGDRIGVPRGHRGLPRRGAHPPGPLPHGGKPGPLRPAAVPTLPSSPL